MTAHRQPHAGQVSRTLSLAGFTRNTDTLRDLQGFKVVRFNGVRDGQPSSDVEVHNNRSFGNSQRAAELDQWADALVGAGYRVERVKASDRTYLLKILRWED